MSTRSGQQGAALTATAATDEELQGRIDTLESRNALLEDTNRQLCMELQRLSRLVYLDPLTGLGNRRYFMRVIDNELRRTTRDGDALALVIGDVDRFKRYNDTYGHAVGDEVLIGVGAAMQRLCRRGGDFAARLGGDEFALLLPGIGRAAAQLLASKLTGESAFRLAKQGLDVTMSFGVAVSDAAAPRDRHQLLDLADRALYKAKRDGRNRAEVAIATTPTADDVR